MSFRLKLLASFTTLFALVLAASLTLVDGVESERAERDTKAALAATRGVFSDLLGRRERELTTSLRLLSGDFAFKQALSTEDSATVLSAAVNHRARIGSDVLLVTGPDGNLLADTRGKLKAGRDPKISVLRDALNGKPGARVVLLDGQPYQLAAVPVLAPDAIGAVAAGFLIDDKLAGSLKKLTESEVNFAADGKIFASTLRAGAREELSARLAGLGAAPTVIEAGGERWLASAESPDPGITATVLRSWDAALEPQRRLRRLLLSLGGAGLLLTVLLGAAIASGVTSSLRKLSAATEKVARGQYDLSLDIRSRDEVGRLGQAFTAMAKGLLEREKIRTVLNKAVSKEIAESLLAQGKIELGGEERTVTILFSDIRSFTTISENMPPPQLVAELNAYFTRMAHAIDRHHGVIDKFVGDAVMALFGAPLATDNDAANGVRAALAMRVALVELNANRARAGLPPWDAGIGLNTGPAVAGTLGSENRWSYTVIGDAVNLASRVEGLTKEFHAPILVTEATKLAAGDGFTYKAVGESLVKGRHEAVKIYEVLGEKA